MTLLVISFNASHISTFYKIYKPFVFLLDTYFVLLLTKYGVGKENFMSKKIVYTLLFVTIYGIFTLFTHSNPIQSIIASAFGRTLLDAYYWGNRIRITSTWSHPIAYGLVCAALFFEYLPYWKKRITMVLMALLAINVFICGSRTSLATFLLMGSVVVLSRYSVSRAIRQVVLLMAILIPVYLAVPFVQDKVDSIINTAQGNDDVGGSSLEMRDEQSYYAMLIVAEKPLMGHGLDYITEGLGYGTDNYKGDWHLLGFESYSYILLIERGFIGFVLEIFIWLAIIAYALKNRKIDKEDASLIMAYVLGFAFFSMSTGTLDTKIPMMFMTGVALSKLSQKKQECKVVNKN